MAISPAHSCLYDYDEEAQMQIMSSQTNNKKLLVEQVAGDVDDDEGLKEKDIVKGLEEDLKEIRALVAALQDEDDVLTPFWWDWEVGVEADCRQAAEEMAGGGRGGHVAAGCAVDRSSHATRRQPALLAPAHAARLRAGVEEVAAAARRLRETDLRRLTGHFSYDVFLTREKEAAVRLEEWMASLAARLTRGAAEFAATPGEEAFVAAMRREAARADGARSVLAWYRAGGGRSVQPAGGGGQVAHAKLVIRLYLLVIVFMVCFDIIRTLFFW